MARRKPKPETAAGKTFATETTGLGRALASTGIARKAAATRRAKARAARDAYKQGNFLVRDSDGFVTIFPCKSATLAEVVADLVQDFGPDGPGIEDEGQTYGGNDLVVWHAGRVVAVVRKGADGVPVGVSFD